MRLSFPLCKHFVSSRGFCRAEASVRAQEQLNPHGMSGSLVRNTRLVQFSQSGKTWTPGVARLTGIVWGSDARNRFLFTARIEHVTALLDWLYP
jgi:hypothetical protein